MPRITRSLLIWSSFHTAPRSSLNPSGRSGNISLFPFLGRTVGFRLAVDSPCHMSYSTLSKRACWPFQPPGHNQALLSHDSNGTETKLPYNLGSSSQSHFTDARLRLSTLVYEITLFISGFPKVHVVPSIESPLRNWRQCGSNRLEFQFLLITVAVLAA